MAKNFNIISIEVIANKALLRLGIYILATRYLDKEAFWFIKVIGDNKETNKEAETVFDSKKMIKIKRVLCKKKKNA